LFGALNHYISTKGRKIHNYSFDSTEANKQIALSTPNGPQSTAVCDCISLCSVCYSCSWCVQAVKI